MSLATIAKIYLGEVESWKQVRSDLADSPIVLVVRIDDCDLNDIVTTTLAGAYPPFAALYPAGTRTMRKADIDSKLPAGSRLVVRETASDVQVDAAITFFDHSFGMRANLGSMPGKVASIAVGAKNLILNSASLASCSAASFDIVSKGDVLATGTTTTIVSRVYDTTASVSVDCWPFSAAYALVIKSALIGRAQVR
jgi:hypothetical protein